MASIDFSRDSSQLLSASFDSTVKCVVSERREGAVHENPAHVFVPSHRLHGLKSGQTLKEFKGHTSFVNTAIFAPDGQRILSGSSDGTVKVRGVSPVASQRCDYCRHPCGLQSPFLQVWNIKTGECTSTFRPNEADEGSAAEITINTMQMVPQEDDLFLVSNRSGQVYIMSFKGKVMKTLARTGKEGKAGGDFVTAIISPRGEYVFAATDDHRIVCFNVESGEVANSFPAHERDIIGLAHHPHQGILASFSSDGKMHLWVP